MLHFSRIGAITSFSDGFAGSGFFFGGSFGVPVLEACFSFVTDPFVAPVFVVAAFSTFLPGVSFVASLVAAFFGGSLPVAPFEAGVLASAALAAGGDGAALSPSSP